MKPVNVDFSLPGGVDDRPEAFSVTNSSLRVMGLRAGSSIYGWIQNRDNTWWNYARGKIAEGIAPVAQFGAVTVYGLTPGMSYSLVWWNTYHSTSPVIATQVVTAQVDGAVRLEIRNLEKDVAFKLRPVTQQPDRRFR